MLEVKGIKNGIVLDHIKAGKGLTVFEKLDLANFRCSVVLLMNVDSKQLGKKDIIKIEDNFDVDLDILGLIDEQITVDIIKDHKLVEKKTVTIPEEISGTLQCHNPRCITNIDDYVSPTFKLIDKRENVLEYVCNFCEEITKFRR